MGGGRETEMVQLAHIMYTCSSCHPKRKRMGETESGREGMDATKTANPVKVKTAVTQGGPLTHPKQWRP